MLNLLFLPLSAFSSLNIVLLSAAFKYHFQTNFNLLSYFANSYGCISKAFLPV